ELPCSVGAPAAWDEVRRPLQGGRGHQRSRGKDHGCGGEQRMARPPRLVGSSLVERKAAVGVLHRQQRRASAPQRAFELGHGGTLPRIRCRPVHSLTLTCHARACRGHPRLHDLAAKKTWMAATSAAMTSAVVRMAFSVLRLRPVERFVRRRGTWRMSSLAHLKSAGLDRVRYLGDLIRWDEWYNSKIPLVFLCIYYAALCRPELGAFFVLGETARSSPLSSSMPASAFW